jgi:hypothetical protein
MFIFLLLNITECFPDVLGLISLKLLNHLILFFLKKQIDSVHFTIEFVDPELDLITTKSKFFLVIDLRYVINLFDVDLQGQILAWCSLPILA